MRLIDADALKTIRSIQSADYNSIETIQNWIDNAPTIDAVPVVRCKDCKYYTNPYRREKKYCTRGAYVKVNDNDYCSFGEKG